MKLSSDITEKFLFINNTKNDHIDDTHQNILLTAPVSGYGWTDGVHDVRGSIDVRGICQRYLSAVSVSGICQRYLSAVSVQ